MQKVRTVTRADGSTYTKKNGTRDLVSMSAPFVAWDGEGISGINPLSDAQSYVMVCASVGRSLCVADRNELINGLPTQRILDFMTDVAVETGKAIHVGFALSYDINQILKDLTPNQMNRLYRTGKVFFSNYNLEWIRGKSLLIRRYPDVVTAENRATLKATVVMTLWDTFPFFQMSFVNTLKEWKPYVPEITDEIIERIHADKRRRNEFRADDMAGMLSYCFEEVRLLAALMEEFRRQCAAVDIVPTRWDGPGAVATALFRRHHIKQYKSDMGATAQLTTVNEAAQYAFTGGRIELVRYGHHDGPVYSYDIRSAYPSVIRKLPNLANGEWQFTRYRSRLPKPAPFALYKVRISNLRKGRPFTVGVMPAWARLNDGSIHYRDDITNWLWSPEYEVLYRRFPEHIKVLEAWTFVPNDPTERPFAFVDEMFVKRAELKAAKNPAQLILKLGLNSLYGKTVQQVGRPDPSKEISIPPYHQLEWAGFTTSEIRARMVEAAYQAGATIFDPGPIISFETDGLISSAEIPSLELGSALGQWEVDVYAGITYVQPGVYFMTDQKGEVKTKTRGFDVYSISEARVIEGWANRRAASKFEETGDAKWCPHIEGSSKAFIGWGRAMESRQADKGFPWRSWQPIKRKLQLHPSFKRFPYPPKMWNAATELVPAMIMAPKAPVESCKFDLKFARRDDMDGIRATQEFGGGFIGVDEIAS